MTCNRRQAWLDFAALLIAAALVLQAGSAFASSLAGSTVAPAATSDDDSCCEIKSDTACGDAGMLEAHACSRHCSQPGNTAPAREILPGSSAPVCNAGAHPTRTRFPEHSPVITAAPKAGSSTLLIYHLQRLLT
jgi:hypothetical protein